MINHEHIAMPKQGVDSWNHWRRAHATLTIKNPIRVFLKQPSMDWGSVTKNGYTGDTANLENGQWYSFDNRRLYAFQQAGITDIPVVDVSGQINVIQSEGWKFTTSNYGSSIELLGGGSCG